jgi:chorismate mutase
MSTVFVKQVTGNISTQAELSGVAAGRDGVRDPEREREVLLRVAMANGGPLPQADLLAVYRALIDALVALEEQDRAKQ